MNTTRVTAAILLLTACTAELGIPEDEVGAQSDELYGSFLPDADCSAADRTFVLRALEYGRIVSASTAFRQCVDAVMITGTGSTGPYMPCGDEPFADASHRVQLDRVLAAAQSPNDLDIGCSGAPEDEAAAWAHIGDYGTTANESLDFAESWLDGQRRMLFSDCPDGVCVDGTNLWPYANVAGTLWHEAMHQQEYDHGDADADDDGAAECGYEPTDGYQTYVNDMPTIIGRCIRRVLANSGAACDLTSCGQGGLSLTTTWGGTSCTCVEDPKDNGLGLIGYREGVLDDAAMSAYREDIGGWVLSESNVVSAVADFTAAGRDSLLLVGSTGITLASMYAGRIDALAPVPVGRSMGSWTLSAGDAFSGAGSIDGWPGAEMVVRGTQGLGILTSDNAGRISTLHEIANGTVLVKPVPIGSLITDTWTVAASDSVEAIGDFTGDGRDDILVANGLEHAILTRTAFGFVNVATRLRSGQIVGSWVWSSRDAFVAAGDFSGDGREDILVSGNEGLGVFTLGPSGLGLVALMPYDSLVGTWTLRATDRIKAIADFDGDGRDDILLRSPSYLGILHLRASKFSAYLKTALGTLLPGGFRLSGSDEIHAAADFDGNGTADILLSDDGGLALLRTVGGFATLVRHPYRDTDPHERPADWDERSVSMLGSWPLVSTDEPRTHGLVMFDRRRHGIGDFDADGRADFAIQHH